ncbi:DUF3499 domain-containing protein [Williamsia soli]|uniref:DUF3499 domain-containing protein n=1 Tax=Williamsia soli TaxID=364929 RepID=UPI001A9EA567|nr:DUF3499 domain-containing protein [Williamsia soli]
MRLPRQCSRPGCANPAVATLTFVYSDSTAVVGPLATSAEPHSWDLCDTHATRITVPRGWEMLRSEGGFAPPLRDEDDLTALADVVREASGGGLVPRSAPVASSDASSPRIRSHGRREESLSGPDPLPRPRPGRRGHLRVLPDPVD